MVRDRLIGVDVGGSRIKGAVVDLRSGKLLGGRERELTPKPATPRSVARLVAEIVGRLTCDGPVGVALPCVLRDGVARSAANIHRSWIGVDATELLTEALGRPVVVLNDADAAGLAEVEFGAARDQSGSVLMFTFGTGIGSALVHDHRVVPNSEFGFLRIGDVIAEKLASNAVRVGEKLSWPKWADRVNQLLFLAEQVIRPDLIVIGGGVSETTRAEEWQPLLKAEAPVVPATLANQAGMVGAALHADRTHP